MFELPEYATFARQMNASLSGKVVQQGSLGNTPHKFVWYNRTAEEFSTLTAGKSIGCAGSRGRWLTLDLNPGYRLVFGECGGRILLHAAGAAIPEKYHLLLNFQDGTALTATTSMWGAMELYEAGAELERQYIKDMRPTPVDSAFTFEYFSGLIDALLPKEKRSLKSLLTQEQLIPGLGNAIAQDILFQARLHPRRLLTELSPGQRQDLYAAIMDTVREVSERGGRYDEIDLYGKAGGYVRLMDGQAAGKPCPECGRAVEKITYLGGACYFCPRCQV
jgi:formamidopyrimidine-DNA glycosylase